jgi:hypothetical protein
MVLIPFRPTIWANIIPLKYNPFTYEREIEKEPSKEYFASNIPGSAFELAPVWRTYVSSPDRF